MPKKLSQQDRAYAFRHALATEFPEAESILAKHPELLDYPAFGKSESALHFYAIEKQLDIVKWLIDHGAKPDGIANDETPLHATSLLGHFSICQALLQAGANPNAIDDLGETPLHKASSRGHLEILKLLLQSGADPGIPEMCGELPIDHALPRKLEQIRAMFDQHGK